MHPWDFRLLLHPPARGAWNMAVDAAIAEAVAAGRVPPTLRLYAWSPPCLSLGYAQSADEVDRAALRERGWDWVRRPTGGRAILHTDELTYAVIAPETHPLMLGGVLPSYQRIAGALVTALQQLGAAARIEGERVPSRQGVVCFEVPSAYEITVDGRKLLGSAQARRQGVVLQHGSLPLWGDVARIVEVLRWPSTVDRTQTAERLRARAITLTQAVGRAVSWDEVARALRTAFVEVLGMRLQFAVLSVEEYERAVALQSRQFGHPSWTMRR